MPTYLYTGEIKYKSTEYGIEAIPGEHCKSRYFLPAEWSEFQLVDANNPVAITPHTRIVNMNDAQVNEMTLDLRGYSFISITLLSAGSSITLKFGDFSQEIGVVLDDNRQEFQTYIPSNISTVYIQKTTSTALFDVLLNTGSAVTI